MTTIEAEATVDLIDAGSNQRTGGIVPPPAITMCGSYKEAKYLAGSRRRSGDIGARHVRAFYLTRLERWCVG